VGRACEVAVSRWRRVWCERKGRDSDAERLVGPEMAASVRLFFSLSFFSLSKVSVLCLCIVHQKGCWPGDGCFCACNSQKSKATSQKPVSCHSKPNRAQKKKGQCAVIVNPIGHSLAFSKRHVGAEVGASAREILQSQCPNEFTSQSHDTLTFENLRQMRDCARAGQ
jgi:hypothetical protein